MNLEIERKFLVIGDGWRVVDGVRIRQSYLCADGQRSVRIRIAGDDAFLTVKGPTSGISRREFEYRVPLDDALQMLELCVAAGIEKVRRRINYRGFVWEVDEFLGANAGLVVAEVELSSEEQAFSRPDWLGEEVTGDPRYYNASLMVHPFCDWGQHVAPS